MTVVYPNGRTQQEIYESLYTNTDYGRKGRGDDFLGQGAIHLAKHCRSMFNVGCGLHDYRPHVPWIERYACCDISEHIVDYQLGLGRLCVQEDLTEGLDALTDSFDVVICMDVLEHIPEESVGFALSELGRCARKMVMLHISYKQTLRTGTQGEPLHLTCESPDWWREKIQENIGVPNVKMRSNTFVVEL